ncbi:MAG: heme lyase CcmF/NrfE family subunit [Actinomycetota bacterium]|nr:heme lyase CcmF/NrfE family subunit [Actinomycetota bacterium]
MTAAVGYSGVLLGAVSAAILILRGWQASRQADVTRRALARPVFGLVAGAVLAMVALEVALLTDDFSLRYVANNSARSTPLVFKVATAWAALEGSIVLWGLVLAVFTGGVWWRLRDGEDRLGAAALATMGVVALFFFGLMATAANPFATISPVPLDGPGPNPLLQNHLMMLYHPPLLYVGLVGWTVPFGFGVGALALGHAGNEWLERTRRWSLIAWTGLTAGVLIGGWWSYEVLGWGGFWAWDPVENASLIPWLTGTALIHSAIAQRHRGVLRSWNVALTIVTFALTILATFLTRSGTINSVHSFTQSAIGPALLAFFVAVLAGGLGLFAARGHHVASARTLDSLASREGAFLVNNLLLGLFAFVVILGTTYPILVEAVTGDQLTVGRPFFDRMTLPIAMALLVAMGIGPVMPYRVARGQVVRQRLRVPVLTGLAAGAALVVAGVSEVWVVAMVMLAVAVVASTVRQLVLAARSAGHSPWLVVRRNPAFWGGQLSHVGVVGVAVGIALYGSLGQDTTLTLNRGETATFAGYEIGYDGAYQHEEPLKTVLGARLAIRRNGRLLEVLEPRVNQYRNQVQAVGTPSVRSSLTDDLYTSLRRVDSEQVVVEVHRYPLMWLLWAGGLTTAVGGVWAGLGNAGATRSRRTGERSAAPRQEVATSA